MIKLNRILWPTDFSRCAKQALGHAVYWAREYDAELHALHAVILLQNNPHYFPNEEAINKQLKDLGEHQLSSTIQALQADDLKRLYEKVSPCLAGCHERRRYFLLRLQRPVRACSRRAAKKIALGEKVFAEKQCGITNPHAICNRVFLALASGRKY